MNIKSLFWDESLLLFYLYEYIFVYNIPVLYSFLVVNYNYQSILFEHNNSSNSGFIFINGIVK